MPIRFVLIVASFASFLPVHSQSLPAKVMLLAKQANADKHLDRSSAPAQPAPLPNTASATAAIADLAKLSPDQGWLLTGNRLLQTTNNGISWADISPGNLGNDVINEVYFRTSSTGWLLKTRSSLADGKTKSAFYVSRTADGGKSWQESLLSSDQQLIDMFGGSADYFFIDDIHGWLLLSYASGPEFRTATLFSTLDGGLTWAKIGNPTFGAVVFTSPQNGWLAGGPSDGHLYQTGDGGYHWKELALPSPVPGVSSLWRPIVHVPKLSDSTQGDLFVDYKSPDGLSVTHTAFHTANGGVNWNISQSTSLPNLTSVALSRGSTPVWVTLAESSLAVKTLNQVGSQSPVSISLPTT